MQNPRVPSLNLPSRGSTLVLWTLAWGALVLLLWSRATPSVLPTPGAVLRALGSLWWEGGLGPELFATMRLVGHATLITVALSLGLAYLSVLPAFRPVVHAVAGLRFAGILGMSVPFTVALGGGHPLKVALLTFGMSTFLVAATAQVVAAIPAATYDYARTLGGSRLRLAWEVVVRGTLHDMLDAVRQNVGMGWAMITAVEGISRAEGGIGALALNQEKHFLLPEVFAVVLVVTVVGLLLDLFLGLLGDALCPHVAMARRPR